MDPSVQRDAKEFGVHARMRGWRLGLLVARCVEPGRPGRRGAVNGSAGAISGKVSARDFAKAAAVSRNTVAAYLTAWDSAADHGKVPRRIDLTPGKDPKLNLNKLPPWEEYYVPGSSWRSPSGGDDEWYTRVEFVEAARTALGGTIDLDPASNAVAQQIVKATTYYSKTDRDENGLALPWEGRVFLNPPFSIASAFGERLIREYEVTGNVTAAVMVLNSYSMNTQWFRPFRKYPWCLASGPAFYKPGSVSNPMAWAGFIYLGTDFNDFVREFSKEEIGTVSKDPTDFEWERRFSRRPA